MTEGIPLEDDNELDILGTHGDTEELLESAKRPLIIAKHQELISDMESGIGTTMVNGNTSHPRLQAMLTELEAESEQQRIRGTINQLIADDHYDDTPLRQALIEAMCLLREKSGVEVAALQLHCLGVYRWVRKHIKESQGYQTELAEIRELAVNRLGRLYHPKPVIFGSLGMGDALVLTPKAEKSCREAIKRMSQAKGGDSRWESAGDTRLSRKEQAPLLELPDEQRAEMQSLVISNKVRRRFYRDVFVRYFDHDQLSPEEISHHHTIFDWLTSIEETAHLYPFMQGQSPQQKKFRLGQLLRKLIQINEMYQRVEQARAHTEYQSELAGKTTREALMVLSRVHFPPLNVTSRFAIATVFCPFQNFVNWVQERHRNEDFVLPPEPKR